MSTALAPRHDSSIRPGEGMGEMSVQAVIDRKRKILEVMNAVMKEGQHYGKIPGCGDKPTLYKSGAEVLGTTFTLAPRFNVEVVDMGGGHREYRVTCSLTHIGTGSNCGEGVGSCSTMESKYRWRGGSRKCPKCGQESIIKGKAEYGGGWLCFAKKGGCGAKWPDGSAEIEKQETGKIENPDIADVYNTCLKMAKKRAQVDATLTAVGASDLLTQDLEDLPAASVPAAAAAPEAAPQANSNGTTFDRQGIIRSILAGSQDGLPFKSTAKAMGKDKAKGWGDWTDAELQDCWSRMQPPEPVPTGADADPFN